MRTLLPLAVMLFFSQGVGAQDSSRPLRPHTGLVEYRAKAMAFIQPEGEPKTKFSLNLVDLNGDGIPEALARVEDSCGSRGCTAYVLDLSGPTARSIGDFTAHTLKALPTKTGAWRDVSVNGYKQVFKAGKYTSD